MYRNHILIDRREMLRVKFNSLMLEARLIRKEERRVWNYDLREELRLHRIGIVRNEARLAALALGLCKGKTLKQMEPICYCPPNYQRLNELMRKYGPKDWQAPEEWVLNNSR